MRKTVVIIGDSPLSTLVGRLLDGDLARETHIEVLHLTRDEYFVYTPHITSLLGKKSFPRKDFLYKHVSCQKTIIKQINLIDRRVISSSGIIDYDALFLDLTPAYETIELKSISEQVTRLVDEIQAKIKTGRQLKARITFSGEDVFSWQMALSLAADLATYPVGTQRALQVQAQYPKIEKLKEFLAENGVNSRRSVALLPGLTIKAPLSPLKNRSVRGALLDDKDNFILRHSLNPEGHPESIIVDSHRRYQQNVLRADHTFATQISANIERFLKGERQRAIDHPRSAGILRGQTSDFVWFGHMQSRRLRAKIVSTLDQRFYRKLFS